MEMFCLGLLRSLLLTVKRNVKLLFLFYYIFFGQESNPRKPCCTNGNHLLTDINWLMRCRRKKEIFRHWMTVTGKWLRFSHFFFIFPSIFEHWLALLHIGVFSRGVPAYRIVWFFHFCWCPNPGWCARKTQIIPPLFPIFLGIEIELICVDR